MTRMRRFLLYVHTGRRAALNALQTVLAELTAHEVRGVIVDEQVDEIRALPDSDVPPGLRETLTGSDVDVLDAVSAADLVELDRKSTRLNSSHVAISYAVFCLKKKKKKITKRLDTTR